MTIPELTNKHKGCYPFRLACPSFIYPAGYVDNVRRLAGCVDEIELLLLESLPGSLPGRQEINELAVIGNDCGLTFNIHLPTDIDIGAVNPESGRTAVDALLRVIDLARPLAPVSATLHIPGTDVSGHTPKMNDWRERVMKNLSRLLEKSGIPPRSVAIETLDYPIADLDPVIRNLDLSVCLDTGHLMVRNEDCRNVFRTWAERIVIVHVHGVESGRDHLALSRLSKNQTGQIAHILSAFQQSLSLEVFSVEALAASLDYLDRIWQDPSQLKNA